MTSPSPLAKRQMAQLVGAQGEGHDADGHEQTR